MEQLAYLPKRVQNKTIVIDDFPEIAQAIKGLREYQTAMIPKTSAIKMREAQLELDKEVVEQEGHMLHLQHWSKILMAVKKAGLIDDEIPLKEIDFKIENDTHLSFRPRDKDKEKAQKMREVMGDLLSAGIKSGMMPLPDGMEDIIKGRADSDEQGPSEPPTILH